ncbi:MULTISPECIES: hypothetical protein [Peribacillus]|uniref:hypothetical protein n=1 Tax=Peribacillus TaxID=2675229 RepID=UPI001912994A|nr:MULTISPECIES: hypothetical protein [unclassified Peribacillus]MBK5461938.1 hypothetical protein [Peribacillus sp. TH27]WMX54864.1 hypothetical protein RE409_22830 [Peribacillus sp. R9-11]
MKFLFNRCLIMSVFLTFSILLIGCSNSSSKVTITKEMDQIVSDTIMEQNKDTLSVTDKKFEAHKIYGADEKDGVISIYLYALYEGYNKSTGTEVQAGGSYPARIKLAKDENGYVLKEYKKPEEGGEFIDSLEDLFPSKYSKQVFKDQGNSADLGEHIQKQVKKWLSKTNK